MTTTVTPPVTTGGPVPRTASRSWAIAGIGAGLAGIGSVVASGFTGAVYDEKIAGDAVAITERLAELTTQILVFHTATTAHNGSNANAPMGSHAAPSQTKVLVAT